MSTLPDRSKQTRDSRWSDRWLIGVFLVLMVLPGVFTASGHGAADSLRNGEAPVRRPSLTGVDGIGPFFQNVQEYLRVSFGLRQMLIEWDARLKLGLALSQSYGGPVTVGQKGWLFYRVHRGRQGVRPEVPFSTEELEHWVRFLESKGQWLEQRGIAFLIVVAPDKESIYPDLLPREMSPARPVSRLDVLMGRLAADGRVRVVDLRPALLAARSRSSPFAEVPLYYRTDSHWNDLGGLIASREVLASLRKGFPNVEIPPDDQFVVETEETAGGDLARMLGLQDRLTDIRVRARMSRVRCEFERAQAQRGQGPETPTLSHGVLECPGASIGRALILHDSMMPAMAPILAPLFERSVWSLGSTLDPGLVERERPDVVMLEFVERSLWEGVPDAG
jgi:alginate O-acetyltransferase complex protein AlgJ